MAEYIERDALLKQMLSLHTIPVYIGHVTDEDVMFETMVDVVKEQPTADVVSVVMCKDCVYWDGLGHSGRCEGYHNGLMRDYTNYDDYCSYGERKSDK